MNYPRIPSALLGFAVLLAGYATASAAPAPAPPRAGPDTPPPTVANPPKSWIDPDTGHRVVRLTDEPGSDSFYFNVNGYTPDGKEMAYTTSDGGIRVLDLKTFATRQVVAGKVRAIVVGSKTNTIYYSKTGDDGASTLWAANLDTGEAHQLAPLPPRASVITINADETLGAGTYIEGEASANGAYDGSKRAAPGRLSSTNLGEPANKGDMMEKRL
ncbi:MAG TPA: hypothetical protein VHV47_15075, partial [Opitutaceae bacterium]|nr:hypothetical protein [Opitutaceae bacterium]